YFCFYLYHLTSNTHTHTHTLTLLVGDTVKFHRMAPDDWPEWLPSDWTVQIRKIDERKVKCYLDPKGQKFYSKPQVFRHLKTIDGSTASEKTHNANGSTGDVSLEPNVPHTNEVGGHSTRQATGSSNKKSKETSGNLAGDGSSSEAEGSQRKDGWLPDGWIVQVKTRASGGHTGMKYKCFTDPITGRKFFSKPQVLNYLASKNGSPAGPREGDRSSTKPNKSQKNGATDVNKDQTIKKTESTRFGYEVISSAPADGLPPGWIKEIRLRNCGSLKKKDPVPKRFILLLLPCLFYVDPLSGYIFFSKLDALRYLDSGDIKKCAMRPLRKDMNEEDYHNANLAGGELASPTDPSKGSQTSEVLSNGRDKRKVRRLSGVGSTPIASQKDESDWLPEGWISEVKVRSNGLRLKYFMESASGRKFYSKPQGGQLAVDPDSSSNSEAADGRRRKRSKKKKKNFVTASPADGLPPGWIKEIRTRKYSTHERKDPYYTDPESGFIFRSKLDALRYLETGDINLCAIRPRKKDENGNEINSTVKQQNAQIHDENHVTDPKTAENTSVSTPPSGRAAKKIAQSRITSRSKSSAAAVPARSSKRLKGPQTEAKGDPMSNDQTIQSESRDLPADDGRGVQEKQVSGVNVEKQAGGEDDLSYQLGDPSWTDQCLDFAVKTLTGEFPVSGRQTSGSFQEGSDGAETGVNETPTKVN
ncbi:DNA-binding, integrase-type, partial [Cynara cardunculus var. scolymus]